MTTNFIAEFMYAACGGSGNQYLIMEFIVDYQNNDKAVTFPYQKVVHRGRIFMRKSTVVWNICVKQRGGF